MAEALGVEVVQHDDGSRDGMHDLDILRADRRDAAEVTAAADAESIQLWKLVTDRGDRWIVPALKGGWSVTLEPSARAKRVLVELPDLLAEMERRGVREYRRRLTRRPLVDPIELHAVDLGVINASQGDTSYPGAIYPGIHQARERMGGIVDPMCGDLPPWVAGFLAEPKQADASPHATSSAQPKSPALEPKPPLADSCVLHPPVASKTVRTRMRRPRGMHMGRSIGVVRSGP